MGDNRKTICLVTTWYPDKENPYRGSFFKEQAFAMSDAFDFLVLHYIEKRKTPLILHLIHKLNGKHVTIQKKNSEKNTVEYDVIVEFPLYMLFWDKIYDFYMRSFKGIRIEGVGQVISEAYKNKKKKYIEEIFTKNFVNEFDVLYCVDAQVESYTLKLISDVTHKPYVVSEHAPFPWPGTTIKDIERAAIMDADLFMAISYDKIRQVLLQNISLKKIAYVGNMVDETQFERGLVKNEVKTFIMVAANSFYKNYALFIKIFNRLTEITEVPFKVMIVGYGANKGYSKDADVLEEQIRNSQFANYVELIPAVSRDRIHEVYQKADAFVMTSVQEGMPVSALEAGCCGLPIFSTMCGGVEDYVDEKVGRIFKIVDEETFAKGLKEYLEGDIVFDSEYIRNHIVSTFGRQAFANNMNGIFNKVIDENR